MIIPTDESARYAAVRSCFVRPDTNRISRRRIVLVSAIATTVIGITAVTTWWWLRRRADRMTLEQFLADPMMVRRMDVYLQVDSNYGLANFAKLAHELSDWNTTTWSDASWLEWLPQQQWDGIYKKTWSYVLARDERCTDSLLHFLHLSTDQLRLQMDLYDTLMKNMAEEMLAGYPAKILERAAACVLDQAEAGMCLWPWHRRFSCF